MAGYTASKMEYALTKETVRGTPATPATGDWIPHGAVTFRPMVSKIENKQGIGTIVDLNSEDILREWSQGAIPANLRVRQLGDWANLIMGTSPTSTGSSTYTHTWEALDNTNRHVSYTVSVIDPVSGDYQCAGGMLNTITLDVPAESYCTVNADIIAGKKIDTDLTSSYSNPGSGYFVPSRVTVKLADSYSNLGSSAALDLKSISLSINKNIKPDDVLGSTEYAGFENQTVSISGTITLKYDSNVLRNYALNNTARAMRLYASSGSYSIQIDLPSVKFRDFSHDSDLASIMNQTVVFNANCEDTTNGLIKIVVVDNIATH